MKISTKNRIILSIIIIVVADFITNWILNIKILLWIWQNILSFQVTLPIWTIILLCLFPLIGIELIIKYKKPDKYKYIEDNIDGVIWNWVWEGNHIRKNNLYPRCPGCMTKLDVKKGFGFLYENLLTCGHCGYVKDLKDDYDNLKKKVSNEIDRRIASGEYKEKMKIFKKEKAERKRKIREKYNTLKKISDIWD